VSGLTDKHEIEDEEKEKEEEEGDTSEVQCTTADMKF